MLKGREQVATAAAARPGGSATPGRGLGMPEQWQKVGQNCLPVLTSVSLPSPSRLGRKWVVGRTRTGISHFRFCLWGQTLSVSFNHKAS